MRATVLAPCHEASGEVMRGNGAFRNKKLSRKIFFTENFLLITEISEKR